MKRNNREQYKRFIRVVFALCLVVCETSIFLCTWITKYNDYTVFPFAKKGHWMMGALYVAYQFIFLYIYGGLKLGYLKKANIIYSQALAAICSNVIIYFQIVLLSVKFVTVIPLLIATGLDILIAVIVVWTSEALFRRWFPPRRMLVIYEEYSPDEFIKKMNTRRDKYRVEKCICAKEGIEKLQNIISQYEAVVIYDLHSELRNKILKYCYDQEIRVYGTFKISDVLTRGAESLHLFDTPLLLYRNQGITFEQRLIKRLMDVVVSLLMLILTSPFFLIAAIAIKLYDGGPVFFRQKRCTVGGKVFRIFKFRSMIVDAEKDGKSQPAVDNDPRITPVGKILRATRVDELPQLLNILNGDMSLVGPRPERVEHVEMYTKEIPEFAYRLKVKGGLTGYAQLYGKYNTSPYDKLKLDLIYIQNYSLWLDIRLILMTIKVMFMKESTEGFTEERKEEIQGKEL